MNNTLVGKQKYTKQQINEAINYWKRTRATANAIGEYLHINPASLNKAFREYKLAHPKLKLPALRRPLPTTKPKKVTATKKKVTKKVTKKKRKKK